MILYIIKVILCSALFLFIYKVLLEKESMYQFNRIYLLAGLVLSFVIPTITFNYYTADIPTIQKAFVNADVINQIVRPQSSVPANNSNFHFPILPTIYITITALTIFRFTFNLLHIFNTIRNNPITHYQNSKLVLTCENIIPHSFLSYIFINREEYNNGNIEHEILLHELTHAQQNHSWDVIFIELMQSVFWFNPLLPLYRKAIRLNHEFLADENVNNTFNNIPGYQYLLIAKASKQSNSTLTSQFNYFSTKKD